MTATKMKSLCLTGPQVRTLLKTGKLVQFVVMEPQPNEYYYRLWTWHHPKYSVIETTKELMIDAMLRYAPFAPGERRKVEGYDLTVAVVAVEAMQRDTEWCFKVTHEKVEGET